MELDRTKPYKMIVIPASDEDCEFEELAGESWDEALKVLDDQENNQLYSATLFEFKTLDEMRAFKKGYEAGIGYLGEGLLYVNINIDKL